MCCLYIFSDEDLRVFQSHSRLESSFEVSSSVAASAAVSVFQDPFDAIFLLNVYRRLVLPNQARFNIFPTMLISPLYVADQLVAVSDVCMFGQVSEWEKRKRYTIQSPCNRQTDLDHWV
jgi:hypothetical protein